MQPEKGVIYQDESCYRFDSTSGVPYLVGSECRMCGFVAFPPSLVCPACLTRGSMEEHVLGSKGTIDTFSVLHIGAPGFNVPYILAYVLMSGGPRILSMITGCEPSEEPLSVGDEVELVVEKIREDREGNTIMGFKFRPLGREGTC